jgi:histidinol phosphatase-like enzyme
MSTNSKMGYHKPNPGMWNICEEECNQGQSLDVANSWFVGDSGEET